MDIFSQQSIQRECNYLVEKQKAIDLQIKYIMSLSKPCFIKNVKIYDYDMFIERLPTKDMLIFRNLDGTVDIRLD